MPGLDSPHQIMTALGLLNAINVVLMRIAHRDRQRLRSIVDDLHGATAPTLARPLGTVATQYDRVLHRLVRGGFVREAIPGHYYTVVSAWDVLRENQRRRVVPFWSAIIAIPVLMVWLTG